MTVVRIDRFTVESDDAEELRARYAALREVASTAFPGLIDTQLAQADDGTWLSVWRWDSLASAKAAIAQAPSVPQAGAAFALAKGLTVEFAEIVQPQWPAGDTTG